MSPGRAKWPDATQATLESIKAKTDNLDVASSTLASGAKQDLMKTTLDNIKLKTDNLDVVLSGVATTAKQDAAKTVLDNISAQQDSLTDATLKVYSREYLWNVNFAFYLQSFSVAAQDTNPYGVFFKPDGTKMYVIGAIGDAVYEYDLSTPWDISTASYLQLFSVAAQETAPYGVFFKPDGTKMYITGTIGADVNEYDLSTPWDVSTASYLQLFSVAAQETLPTGVFFKPDGTKMYVLGTTGDDVNEYDLSTPWDISTAVYLQVFSVAAQETDPQDLFFKPDGMKMYVLGTVGKHVNEYDLSTPWNISTASYLQNFSVEAQETAPTGVFFKPDGAKMYVLGATDDDVNEYDVGIPLA